jgi:hypothetical protein
LYVANFNGHAVARFNGGTGAYVSNFVAAGAGGLTTPNFLLIRWNPATYSEFQHRFFGATNAPSSSRADDPDGDGASNELEYLTRTHPLDAGDAWRIGISNVVGIARLDFPQVATRGFEVQHSFRAGPAASWQTLTNLAASPTNRTAIVGDSIDSGTNRFYRVRVFEP